LTIPEDKGVRNVFYTVYKAQNCPINKPFPLFFLGPPMEGLVCPECRVKVAHSVPTISRRATANKRSYPMVSQSSDGSIPVGPQSPTVPF
jgi:hypothetical protein